MLVKAYVSPIEPAAPLLDVCRTESWETVQRGGVVVVVVVCVLAIDGVEVEGVPPPDGRW